VFDVLGEADHVGSGAEGGMMTFLLGLCVWLLIACLTSLIIGPLLHDNTHEPQ
jgi:hypothetical protein